MTRPTARVLALLEILQAGDIFTAADLAGRLGVDERTLRRYVEHLLDLDIPVRSERGRYGGYRLAPGYRMPPLMLTDDEALAVLLGLVSARRSGLVASAPATEAATAKVRRVLPEALGRRLDALLATAALTAPEHPAEPTQTTTLLALAEAARGRRPVEIAYVDRHDRPSTRVLHPFGIVAHHGRWYVVGEDPAKQDVRSFRLDRVRAVREVGGTFDVPPGVDPAARLVAGIAEAPHRYDVVVHVEGTVEHVRSRVPPVGVVSALDEETVEVRIRAERLDWVAPLLIGIDRPFTVVGPQELRELLRDLAARLTASARRE